MNYSTNKTIGMEHGNPWDTSGVTEISPAFLKISAEAGEDYTFVTWVYKTVSQRTIGVGMDLDKLTSDVCTRPPMYDVYRSRVLG